MVAGENDIEALPSAYLRRAKVLYRAHMPPGAPSNPVIRRRQRYMIAGEKDIEALLYAYLRRAKVLYRALMRLDAPSDGDPVL